MRLQSLPFCPLPLLKLKKKKIELRPPLLKLHPHNSSFAFDTTTSFDTTLSGAVAEMNDAPSFWSVCSAGGGGGFLYKRSTRCHIKWSTYVLTGICTYVCNLFAIFIGLFALLYLFYRRPRKACEHLSTTSQNVGPLTTSSLGVNCRLCCYCNWHFF